MHGPLVVGHRGAPRVAPENTLRSYWNAIRLGADMVELDVHETADGHLVCIHDYTLSRTTSGKGYVADMGLAELRTLDAGDGERIPLLEEALDQARSASIGVDIELKVPDIERDVMRMVSARSMEQSVIVSSFHHMCLREVRRWSATVRTALVFMRLIDDVCEYAHDYEVTTVIPEFATLERGHVSMLHSSDLEVYAWVVNEEHDIRQACEMGVDGIITDDCALARRVVDEIWPPGSRDDAARL